ncbi:integrase family protein [Burkholderia sp. MR1]|nr:integrase family protein [Burkholderia sp. MR1]
MPAKALTAAKIHAAKPKAKPYKLSDLDRLYVLVSTAGSKTWKWAYRLDGKDSTCTLGTFPEMGVAEARHARAEAEKVVKAGQHPAAVKAAEKAKAKEEAATTLWGVTAEWIDAMRGNWSPYYLQQVENFMGRYVRDGELGNRPIKSITPADVFGLVSGVAVRKQVNGAERKATGSPHIATLLRQWLSAVFRRAVISGRADRNPVTDLKASDVIAKPKTRNNRALSEDELRDLLKAMAAFSGTRSVGIAMELLMLAFVRTTELRAATWGEFDLDKATWTIPAERMKIKHVGDHVVPLCARAVELLKELREINPPAKSGPQWLFPNRRRGSADCMAQTTLNRALERMGFNGAGSIGFSGHGFRGTASTLLHEQHFAPEVIEAQLAHRQRSHVSAAYNKAQYLPARRKMMTAWGDYIEGLKVPAAVQHAA